MLEIQYSFFTDLNDGNLALNSVENRIMQIVLYMRQGVVVRLEDGTECRTEQELREAVENYLN